MGLIHIYCGDDKGKTTAAFGLALRAAGSGMKVHIVQLMKGNETSELNSLEKLDGITLSRCDKNYGFTFRMTEQERNEITLCHNRLLNEAYDLMQSGSIDMLIIDEDTWIGFRLSGTEPIVRLYAESTTNEKLKKLVSAGEKFINGK